MSTQGTKSSRSVLITGANSGLGFEAAAQFTGSGSQRVILVCRDLPKAVEAKSRLVERSGADIFEPLGIDISDMASVEEGARQLAAQGEVIDVLILNAGVMPGQAVTKTRDGYDLTYATALVGHHLLTMRLLEAGLLAKNARIVIAGSEAARGDVLGMTLPDYHRLAATEFNGDLQAMIVSFLHGEAPVRHKWSNSYATGKMMVAWWAAALSRVLPAGTIVNAVSPGGTPATNFARDAGFLMRTMMSVMTLVGPATGMMHTVRVGARRYVDAASFDDSINGQFLASPPKKMTGKLVRVATASVLDEKAQSALWSALIEIAGSEATVTARSAA